MKRRLRTQFANEEDPYSKKQNFNNSIILDSTRCNSCKQELDGIVNYNGHPNNSSEEYISLTNETLLIFTGDEGNLAERDLRPLHKLTGFSVYDDQGHLTPFDNGLVEEDTFLRLSGYIKPIYKDDPCIDDGIPTHDIGPIRSWYISGFDGGEKAFVGVITAYAEYILMEPSPEYAATINTFLKKIPLLKTTVEFLLDYGWENPNYEDLLSHLQTCGSVDFEEEFLLQNAHFICNQVYSFENAAPDEDRLMTIPCMKTLVELSGVVLTKPKTKSHASRQNVSRFVERKATTTPLVRSIFEIFFPQQIAEESEKFAKKKKRCGICDACQTPDCGKCGHCRAMTKFGGGGKKKQACKLRICPNMELEDSDSSDSDDQIKSEMNFTYKPGTNKVEFLQEPFLIRNEKRFYHEATVGGRNITPGDCVLLNPYSPDRPRIIGKVISIFTKYNQPYFHAQMFCRGIHTILGETADPQELFLVDVCEDYLLGSIVGKAEVSFRRIPEDWSELGGIQTLENPPDDDNKFFYNKRYDDETARFTEYVEEEIVDHTCPCCRKSTNDKTFENTIFEGNSIRWKNQIYEIGSSVFLDPSVYKFKKSRPKSSKNDISPVKFIDEDKFPEFYRKISDPGDSFDITEPFCVARIEDIYATKSEEIKIKVRIFYRPEDTINSIFLAHEKDWNLVYWTEEVISTSFKSVIGKCYLTYCEISEASDWSEKGPFRFYFTEAYNPKTFQYYDVPKDAFKVGYFGKGKGKGKGMIKSNIEMPPEWEKIHRPLRCMDVFAGCGGLSLGLHQSGAAETKWAIENMAKPAEAFKINNHECRVFREDCNKALKDILSQNTSKGFPKKGDVEILVGGPPCQGFSHMNRFSARQNSLLKNSLIVTLLGFCDYYRPKFFILENVRNFALFRHSMVLKLTVRCLLAIGYQVAFGIMQAAHYGLPQTRRRFVLIAAAPGYLLPQFPQPQHVFEKKDYHLSVKIDGVRYYKDSVWKESAPYRSVCVRDAISDLPNISNGHINEKMQYDEEPFSHFQRQLRGNNGFLYDHICKEMAPIAEARISHIPCIPGSDWRDLPNICVKLRDGTITYKLQYPYFSKNQKKCDKPRAVCQCNIGKSCKLDRQLNTLIPWCLPHTADRHNNWAGLYGRLGWDEVFRTTITNPEPIGKQGKVIHPEQHRVVSVRECARSQGFPDQFRFFGNILDKYRQIGNAVPPPLGKAIGLELRKSLALLRPKNE